MRAVEQGPSRGEQVVLFARNFFKHPRMLGSLIPSSRFLIHEVLGRIDWSWPRVIVEYGPGVGSFTTEILKRMRHDATLVVFETNPDFVRLLRRSYDDVRLKILHRSAAELGRALEEQGLGRADYVISGIPFSTMRPQLRESILQKTHDALNPRGRFLVYQFSGEVLPDLRRIFGKVETDFELLNVLPARIFTCSRNGERKTSAP
jgi:phospholipid N-methyltransferase